MSNIEVGISDPCLLSPALLQLLDAQVAETVGGAFFAMVLDGDGAGGVAVVAVPQFEKARVTQAKQDVGRLQQAVELWRSQNPGASIPINFGNASSMSSSVQLPFRSSNHS